MVSCILHSELHQIRHWGREAFSMPYFQSQQGNRVQGQPELDLLDHLSVQKIVSIHPCQGERCQNLHLCIQYPVQYEYSSPIQCLVPSIEATKFQNTIESFRSYINHLSGINPTCINLWYPNTLN
eukprot:TRINITY_DN4348_c1_g3_i1.p1 TRINITY_DN4348_c1_g3~~TRINITY_DN4348_c1_g3_i1.p1  ORF type:complete len:125 (-),score=3.68 TRINITY_DN4348_c1_g3_i1:827-1201(-)